MKYIYEEDLKHLTNGHIDWIGSLGNIVRFCVDDFYDSFQIVDVQGHNVTILYNGEEIIVESHGLKKGNGLLKILGIRKDFFMYNIGDIINDFLILECKREPQSNGAGVRKMYYYECTKCHYKGWKCEGDLRQGCPVCEAGEIIQSEVNSLKIKKPYIYSIVIDENKNNMAPCTGIVHWKCPWCNQINYTKLKELDDDKPLPCKYCGDGVSYPEKILYNALYQVSKSFEMQKTFVWSEKKKYDYYDKGIFVEIHGNQHYEKDFSSCGGRTLEEEKENDIVKENLAKNFCANFIDYIIIDARKSDFDFIKNSIINSRLTKYYDLSKIDWDIVKENSNKSFLIETCEMYNDGGSVAEISNILKKSEYTIRKYLRVGNKIKLCNYNPRDYRKNPLRVKCHTGEEFMNAAEAAKWCGLKYHSSILEQIKGIYNYAGLHPETGEKLTWEIIK